MVIIQPQIIRGPVSDQAAILILWTYAIGAVVIIAMLIYMWYKSK